ncbi:unnamed protein product [Didymodactylos carnosus]|nr:unnamed protein product [Didymodactylos carnosus]CAF4004308.1 unnamed protein product [Didymodactylos carnosus]
MVNGTVELSVTINDITTVITALIVASLGAKLVLVSPPKCSIAVEKIEFLSHIITGGKVEPSPDKVKAIVDIASSKTLSQANKFIGKVGYYRKFIRDFAKIAAPIHKICYYKSPLLNDTERRYPVTEREALAIYWCLTELRNYIGDSEIIIKTNHKPLVNMHKKKNYGNKRIDNWLTHLQDLIPQIIEIQYRRGIDNIGPDYLTRYETIGTDNQQQSLSGITRSMTKQVSPSASLPPTVTEQSPITTPPLSTSTPIADFSLEKIKTEQDNDTDIQLIISHIHAQKEMDNFVPYLPASMLNIALKAFHDHPMSGHFEVHGHYIWFWWPNMRQSIEHYISSCQQCMKFNILSSKTPGHLKSFDPPTDVFQSVTAGCAAAYLITIHVYYYNNASLSSPMAIEGDVMGKVSIYEWLKTRSSDEKHDGEGVTRRAMRGVRGGT